MKGKNINELTIGESASQLNNICFENAKKYAEITLDNNPLHFDTDEAKNSRYHKPIAHGMILAGFVSGVIGTQLPGFGCIYAKQSFKFMSPVFYGDVIKTVVTVKDILKDRNRVVLKTECFNQNGIQVLDGEAVVLPVEE